MLLMSERKKILPIRKNTYLIFSVAAGVVRRIFILQGFPQLMKRELQEDVHRRPARNLGQSAQDRHDARAAEETRINFIE